MHICMYVCIEYRMSMMCECTCAHVCLYVAQMVGAGSRDHHVNTVQIIYISCVCVYIIAICSKWMNYLSCIHSTKGQIYQDVTQLVQLMKAYAAETFWYIQPPFVLRILLK